MSRRMGLLMPGGVAVGALVLLVLVQALLPGPAAALPYRPVEMTGDPDDGNHAHFTDDFVPPAREELAAEARAIPATTSSASARVAVPNASSPSALTVAWRVLKAEFARGLLRLHIK